VAIKSEHQQAITSLHRMRSQWMATRTARINALRGLLSEFGLAQPAGASRFVRELAQLLEDKAELIPCQIRYLMLLTQEEIRGLEERIEAVEQELEQVVRQEPTLEALRQIPGIGTLTASAIYASVGNIHAFRSGRHLASWLGLTPRESSSGSHRRLGRISKQGDAYLRMRLIHGARSALLAAERRRKEGQRLTRVQAWALERAEQGHRNRATVALANKMARIAWAVWKHERAFDGNYVSQAA
jgi:transposase